MASKKKTAKAAAKPAAKSAKKLIKTAMKTVGKLAAKVAKGKAAPAPKKAEAPAKGKGKAAPAPAPVLKGKAAQIAAANAAKTAAPAPLKGRAAKLAAARNGCREVACELSATTKSYCRLHYLKNWKKIQRKEQILREKKLNHYIEELVSKYPDKYIEAIRQDLHTEKDFAKVISDLELDGNIDDIVETEPENEEAAVETIRHATFDDSDDGDIF